ncbi:MAG: GGDEF domain-containing protein [Thioalkalivibrionaceae bacterium]
MPTKISVADGNELATNWSIEPAVLSSSPVGNASPDLWITIAAVALVTIGLLGLIHAIGTFRKILQDLPDTPIKRRWRTVFVILPMFVLGYLAFGFNLLLATTTTPSDVIVALVFGFGALFVALTGRLSLDAVHDIRRVVRLEHESLTDALTGLPNRRKFDQCFHRELERARRYSTPLSLLIIDVDHFKAVNDTYGHSVGDAVLKTLAERLQSRIRSSDDIARLGGEELVIVAPETSLSNAASLGEKIRCIIADTPFTIPADVQPLQPTPKEGLKITVSVGVASHRENHPDFETFVHEADAALYRAKSDGRNCVALAETCSTATS